MKTFRRDIFEQLGYLFYAIAAEQDVSALAWGELKMLFRKDWMTENDDTHGDRVPEAAHLIALTVDSLQNEQASPSEAFAAFEMFYWKHVEQFSFALKQDILDVAEKIVKLFPANGKKNVYAENLQRLLQPSMEGTESGRSQS